MADVNMTINGEENSDTLSAAEGLDILNGEAGDDVLFGDQGNYSLIGGTGVDIFEFVCREANQTSIIQVYTA